MRIGKEPPDQTACDGETVSESTGAAGAAKGRTWKMAAQTACLCEVQASLPHIANGTVPQIWYECWVGLCPQGLSLGVCTQSWSHMWPMWGVECGMGSPGGEYKAPTYPYT